MSKSVKRALVTGAGRGLGRHLTQGLLDRGWQVLACQRDQHDEGPPQHPALTVLQLEQGNADSIRALARAVAEHSLDLLLINAAVRGDTGGLPGFSASDFLDVMAINVAGPMLLVQSLIAQMPNSGKIAFISSRAGSIAEGADPDGDYSYCASKAALNRLMVKLADDYPQTFLALHPGWLRTDMGGLDAELDPAVSADALLDLIERARSADSGTFRAWNGESVRW